MSDALIESLGRFVALEKEPLTSKTRLRLVFPGGAESLVLEPLAFEADFLDTVRGAFEIAN